MVLPLVPSLVVVPVVASGGAAALVVPVAIRRKLGCYWFVISKG